MVLTNYKPHTADEVSLELTAQIIQEQKDKTRVVVEQQVRESLCGVVFLVASGKNISSVVLAVSGVYCEVSSLQW